MDLWLLRDPAAHSGNSDVTYQEIQKFCPGCFSVKGAFNPCPLCGYDERAPRNAWLLPHRTLLHGQYVVGRVLGKPGGFGITYLGWDLHLQTRVAIKEYLPREWAGRAADQATVVPHTAEEGEWFQYGLERFLTEARTLAQIDQPNVARVLTFFTANRTAYFVMDYYQGLSLAEYLERQGGRLPEEAARQLIFPILDGLRAVHAKGFLHRDIKPQNIYLAQTDGGGVRPILLDFGSARHAMDGRTLTRTVMYTASYSPIEQLHEKGKQGPWTDIYSIAAVLYRLDTGITPPESFARLTGNQLKPAEYFGVSKSFSDALRAGLEVQPEDRPQTIEAFQIWLTRSVSAKPRPVATVPHIVQSPRWSRTLLASAFLHSRSAISALARLMGGAYKLSRQGYLALSSIWHDESVHPDDSDCTIVVASPDSKMATRLVSTAAGSPELADRQGEGPNGNYVAESGSPAEERAKVDADNTMLLPADTLADQAAPAMALFVDNCRDPAQIRLQVSVNRLPFLIGRGADADFTLEDFTLSREHARIVAEGSKYFVEDLRSANGTFLNGRLVKAGVRVPFHVGDVLQLGQSRLTFVVDISPMPDLSDRVLDGRYRLKHCIHQSIRAATYEAEDQPF